MPFNGEGRFVVSDESVANEIRNKYPATTTVTRVTANHASDRGHKYFFSCPAMPWHEQEKEDENEVRYFVFFDDSACIIQWIS